MPVDSEDNRAFCLTGRGAAALAVLRVAGPAVGQFFATHFSRSIAPSKCVHGELRNQAGETIDDPVVVLSDDLSSADISLHGGAWVVEATLDLLSRCGFKIVNDPTPELLYPQIVDPNERNVLAALPRATTALGLQALLAQVDAWRDLAPSPQQLDEMRRDRALYHLLHPPTVAIVGPANAGKSTLANRLLAHDRSIVADSPGTTRDWVGERADLDGLPVLLVDTPGIRASDDLIEQQAIARSGERIATADLILLVLDASRPLEPEQAPLIARFASAVRVINKCDQPAAFDLDNVGGIRCVATCGQGIDKIVETIQRHFGVWEMQIDKPRIVPFEVEARAVPWHLHQPQDVVVSDEQK